MCAGRHQGAESSTGGLAVGADVNYILHLGVVEEEAVDGSVAAGYETGSEALEVESCYACFLAVAAADEFNEGVCVVGVEIYDLCRKLSVLNRGLWKKRRTSLYRHLSR